jgi:hypothetical protein
MPTDPNAFNLTQIFCDVESRIEYGIAVSDGQPVLPYELDHNLSHFRSVPVVRALLIPTQSPKQIIWEGDFCEICRRGRVFRPIGGFTFDSDTGGTPNNRIL